MKNHTGLVHFVSALFAIGLVSALPTPVHADIMGFGNFSGFTVNQNDAGSPPTVSTGAIELTSGGFEDRSIFDDTRQSISEFTASFIYQGFVSGAPNGGVGACFVLQNSSSGANAVGGAFGYVGIPGDSLGVTLELSGDASGYYTDGNFGGGSPSASPVVLGSNDPIKVTLTYNGSILQDSLLDMTTDASYSNSFLVLTPLSTLLGGSSAYVGLSAATYDGGNQTFSDFQFTNGAPVPEPSSLALLGMGAGALCFAFCRRRSRAFPSGEGSAPPVAT